MKITCIDKEVKNTRNLILLYSDSKDPIHGKKNIKYVWTILWSETDYFIWSIVVYKQEMIFLVLLTDNKD